MDRMESPALWHQDHTNRNHHFLPSTFPKDEKPSSCQREQSFSHDQHVILSNDRNWSNGEKEEEQQELIPFLTLRNEETIHLKEEDLNQHDNFLLLSPDVPILPSVISPSQEKIEILFPSRSESIGSHDSPITIASLPLSPPTTLADKKIVRDRRRRDKITNYTQKLLSFLPEHDTHTRRPLSQAKIITATVEVIHRLRTEKGELGMRLAVKERESIFHDTIAQLPELSAMTSTFNQSGVFYAMFNPHYRDGLADTLAYIHASSVFYEILGFSSLSHFVWYHGVMHEKVAPIHHMLQVVLPLLSSSPPNTICKTYFRSFCANGKEFEMKLRLTLVRDQFGRPLCFLALGTPHDITFEPE